METEKGFVCRNGNNKTVKYFIITNMRTLITLFLLLAAIIFSGCTKAADTTTLRATGYCWTCELQVTPTTTEVRDTCMSDNTYPRWTNEHGYIPQVKCNRR